MRLYHVKFQTIAWKNMESWLCAENLEMLIKKLEEHYGKVTIIQCGWEA